MKLQKKTTPKKPVKPVKGGTLSSRGVRRIGNVIRNATAASAASVAMLNKRMSIKPPVMANRTFAQPVAKSAMPFILPTYPISHHPLRRLSQSPKRLSTSQIVNIDRLLTYEILGELYSHELLNVEIEILTKNAEKIAIEVNRGIHATDINIEELKKRVDETIERKISECKERARERLLYVYNTTMFGNSEGRIAGGKAGRKTGGIGSDTNSNRDAYDAWYGVDDTTGANVANVANVANANAAKTDKTIFEKWKLSLNLFTFASRVFVFCINLLKQNRWLSLSALSQPNYKERMQEIHKGLLKTLKQPRIDRKKLMKIEKEFLSVATGKVIHSLKERDKIETMKGDLTELYKAFQPPKSSSTYNGMFDFYQPFASKNKKLYGMPLPYQFDRGWIFRNMLYVLEKHNIKNYVDLHDCEGMTNIHGCNPYDFGGEREMFELAVKVSNHHHPHRDRKYINIRDFVDMTAGSSTAWISISKIPDTSIHETLVHCYAGMGRTGCVLLFLLLRDTTVSAVSRSKSDVSIESDVRYDIANRLQMPHLGYASVFALHTALVKLFDTKAASDDDSYDVYAIDYVVKELLDTTRIIDIHLLRKRLNRIFFFLAKKHITPSVYLYQSLPPEPYIFNKIKDNIRRKTEGLSETEIENHAHVQYGERIMDGKDREYHFSKPVAIQMNWEKWNKVEGMDKNKLERILDGDTISSIF
jgi:hypothetical protein